jgi:hypothetical protein
MSINPDIVIAAMGSSKIPPEYRLNEIFLYINWVS